jgi:hypothetical protein
VDPTTFNASHAGTEVELAPIKVCHILPTVMADALLRAKRAMPDRLGGYDLNYVKYFLHCHLFLQATEERGFDISTYRIIYDQVLAGMPTEVQDAARELIAAEPLPERPSLILRAKRTVGSLIEHMRGPRLPGEVDAARLGLHNIVECATYIGGLVDRRIGATSR